MIEKSSVKRMTLRVTLKLSPVSFSHYTTYLKLATTNSFVKSVISTKNRNQSPAKNLILAYTRPTVKKQKKEKNWSGQPGY